MTDKCPNPTLIPMTVNKVQALCGKGLQGVQDREDEFLKAVAKHALDNVKTKRGQKWWQKWRPLTPAEAQKEAEDIVYNGELCNRLSHVYERDTIREHRATLSKLLDGCRHVSHGSDIWISLDVAALFQKYQ